MLGDGVSTDSRPASRQPTVRKMTIASHGSPSGWCGRTAMKLPDQWPKQQFLMFLAKPLTMIKHHQPLTVLSLFRDQDANVAPQYFAENCQGVAEGRFCFFYQKEPLGEYGLLWSFVLWFWWFCLWPKNQELRLGDFDVLRFLMIANFGDCKLAVFVPEVVERTTASKPRTACGNSHGRGQGYLSKRRLSWESDWRHAITGIRFSSPPRSTDDEAAVVAPRSQKLC